MSAPPLAVGDVVRVRSLHPPGHVRTPFYCRGKTGRIERLCGEFRNPESLAYGDREASLRRLYRVQFASRDLFDDYAGPERDVVEIEIYEHWLEPAGDPPAATPPDQTRRDP
jgi:nitrile hydratase